MGFELLDKTAIMQIVETAYRILEEIGIEPERVEMFNLSSGEGPRFAEIANEMTETIKALGPSPVTS